MEENTIPSGADDKTKPQEIETQQAGDQESSEQVESKENEVQESASEQIPDKVDEPIEVEAVEAVEKRNEISKEINISELSIDALVDLFPTLPQGMIGSRITSKYKALIVSLKKNSKQI